MKFKKEHYVYVILYALAFAPILFNSGVFWDDWCIYNTAPEARLLLYSMSGRPFFGIFFNTLFYFSSYGVLLGRLLIFISYLLSGLILNSVLSKVKEISYLERIFIVVIFLIYPINFSRVAITNLQYGFCFCLFFIATALLNNYLQNSKLFFRILSLILFFISFTTESLILFYVLPLFYLGYCNKDGFKKAFVKYLDFAMLPILAVLVKFTFLKPYGIYSNFNRPVLNLSKIIYGLNINLKNSLNLTIQEGIFYAKSFSLPFLFLILLNISLLLFFFKKEFNSRSPAFFNIYLRKAIFNTLFGLGIFAISVIPYIVVGKIGTANDWDSRHQILNSLGIAFLLSSLVAVVDLALFKIKIGLRSKIQIILYSFFFSMFILFNFSTHVNYQKDWWKQQSLMLHLKERLEIQTGRSFLFIDHATELNARSRSYRDYEFSGMMKYLFNNEKRYGGTTATFSLPDVKDETLWPWYNIQQFVPIPYQYKVNIENADFELSSINVAKLYFYSAFNTKKYFEHLKQIIKIEITRSQ